MYRNLFLVFFLSGVWHGAGWNYILWGVMHGALYCVTRWLQKRFEAKKVVVPETDTEIRSVENTCNKSYVNKIGTALLHVCKVFATFLYVNIAWVFFRSTSISQAVILFKRMFTGGITLPSEAIYGAFNLDEFWYVMKVLHLTEFPFSNYILMVVFTGIILLVTFFGKNVHELAAKWKMSAISAIAVAFVFVWCVVSLSGVSTFLYFNF